MQSLVFRMSMTALLFVLSWLLWSGMYKPLLLALGAFSVIITMIFAYRMNYFKKRAFALRFTFATLQYWGWLFVEVLKSSIQVTKEILKPTIEVSPVVIEVPRQSRSDFQTMMLGNSITLTPGTITLDVDEDVLLVHALTKEGAADLTAGEMARRVDALGESA